MTFEIHTAFGFFLLARGEEVVWCVCIGSFHAINTNP